MPLIPPHRALALALPLLLLGACGGSADPAAPSTSGSSRSGGTTPATLARPTRTVSLVEPANGAAVAGGVAVSMTAEGITIETAGEVRDGAGHFHVIADVGCVAPGASIPVDADHVHLGGGQSKATIYLAPGLHKLCLQAGDGVHAALDATDTVTVDVGIHNRDQWCAAAGEANEIFDSNEDDTMEFPVRQVGYENGRRLLAQLTEALDQVDADVRDDVALLLDFGSTWATAFVQADDYQEAYALIPATRDPSGGPGSAWILDTCGVKTDSSTPGEGPRLRRIEPIA